MTLTYSEGPGLVLYIPDKGIYTKATFCVRISKLCCRINELWPRVCFVEEARV